jgi:RNA polymerase sigma-70 factor (ECF subfamily)
MKQEISQPKPTSTQDNISLHAAGSFQHLYSNTNLIVFRFIYGLHGGPTEDVEDLTAETFARAWKARRKFLGSEQAALAWLLKIARNLVIDVKRRQKILGYTQDIERQIIKANDLPPEEETQMREQIKTLWILLQNLTDIQREILVLRYILGWRVQEIGHHLDMKENTVSVYIRRSIKYLRREWPE